MSGAPDNESLLKQIKVFANEHYESAEVRYLLDTKLTPARARCWIIHQIYFVRNRRDCWALAMGQAPLDVKRGIWRHEQDELISDPRAGGQDHHALISKEAKALGVSEQDVARAELQPFSVAAFEAWLHLGKQSWLESFVSVATVEAINSNAIVPAGGFSHRMRAKLVAELGIQKELLVNRNVHVEADQEHALLLDEVILNHVKNAWQRELVIASVKKSLVIDRAYRGGVAFAMRQISDAGASAA